MNKRSNWWFEVRFAGRTKVLRLLVSPAELLRLADKALLAGAIGVSWQAWEGR